MGNGVEEWNRGGGAGTGSKPWSLAQQLLSSLGSFTKPEFSQNFAVV